MSGDDRSCVTVMPEVSLNRRVYSCSSGAVRISSGINQGTGTYAVVIILPAERRLDWNNAPVALVAIIVINILVFFLYQAGDDIRFYQAVQSYLQQDYRENTWGGLERHFDPSAPR